MDDEREGSGIDFFPVFRFAALSVRRGTFMA